MLYSGGRPDLEMVKLLQDNYEKGLRLDGRKFGRPVLPYCVRGCEDLVKVTSWAMGQIAAPEEVHASTLMDARVRDFL